ncbi:hypothetical protein DFJ58DRAFT_748933 [Suillus subalutaceus]|uniref:uncharacterized protein n=1 Tax=Suillus subalutaceus TaxID=48586 RepID=UPI001B87CF6E|nr:uncharacterized protein DFJ58DRAFT_748933 [Suillus subalutaceus]KAG1839754.1 hypothetical protein DFJ58DRAFT_748933 [Suillus subalutaceus]
MSPDGKYIASAGFDDTKIMCGGWRQHSNIRGTDDANAKTLMMKSKASQFCVSFLLDLIFFTRDIQPDRTNKPMPEVQRDMAMISSATIRTVMLHLEAHHFSFVGVILLGPIHFGTRPANTLQPIPCQSRQWNFTLFPRGTSSRIINVAPGRKKNRIAIAPPTKAELDAAMQRANLRWGHKGLQDDQHKFKFKLILKARLVEQEMFPTKLTAVDSYLVVNYRDYQRDAIDVYPTTRRANKTVVHPECMSLILCCSDQWNAFPLAIPPFAIPLLAFWLKCLSSVCIHLIRHSSIRRTVAPQSAAHAATSPMPPGVNTHPHWKAGSWQYNLAYNMNAGSSVPWAPGIGRAQNVPANFNPYKRIPYQTRATGRHWLPDNWSWFGEHGPCEVQQIENLPEMYEGTQRHKLRGYGTLQVCYRRMEQTALP